MPWQIKSLSGSYEQIALMHARRPLYVLHTLCRRFFFFPHLRIPPFAFYTPLPRFYVRVRAQETPRVFSLLAARTAVCSYSA